MSLHKKVGFSIKGIIDVIRVVEKEKPDIIHSHINSLQYTIIPQIFLSKGVHTVHNEAHLEAKGLLEVNLRKVTFKLGLVQPVTISPESHDSFVKFYKRNAPMINNGRTVKDETHVDAEVKKEIDGYRRSPQSKIIVQLARFQPQKNIPMMARVATHLYSEGYDFVLLFIGSTENREIKEEVIKLMPPCAHILGEKKNSLEYLKEADAFALSSEYEGMPISLIESFAVGAIPVCTPVGGIPNAVEDGKNGFLSNDNCEDSYYDALKRFLDSDNDTLKNMKSNAKDSFAPYDMKNCAIKYLQLYDRLLNKKI